MLVFMILFHACNNRYCIYKQECGDMSFEKTINLQLDTLLCSQIADFYPIDKSSFVLTDGACIYKTDSTGTVIEKINDQGHGKKEYIRIGKLFSDGQYIYAWCEMSLYLYKYDLDLNYIDKFQGPNHAITKFVVAGNDTAYFLLSGGFDESIGILPLKHKETVSYVGCYTNEDKALLVNSISGGIAVYDNSIKYVKPSEMEIWTVEDDATWLYDDKDFLVNSVTGDIYSRSHEEMLDYILNNSICSGLYGCGANLWLITETGSLKAKDSNQLSNDNRYFNIFKINKKGEVVLSKKYNYPGGFKYLIKDNCVSMLFYDGNYYTIKQHTL